MYWIFFSNDDITFFTQKEVGSLIINPSFQIWLFSYSSLIHLLVQIQLWQFLDSFFRRLFSWQSMIVHLQNHLKYHRRVCFQYWIQSLLWYFRWYSRWMLLDCQLKSRLLKNYFKTIIVEFGKVDGLDFNPCPSSH